MPDGVGPLVYKAVAASDRLSDGEEGPLVVLSRRVQVVESMPLPIRGPGTKQFDFTKMRESGKSDTIRTQVYTVQMTSQPAWYAVMALPYLRGPRNLGYDDWDLNLAKYESVRRTVLEWGQFPWWDPSCRAGFPLAANPQCGVVGVATPLVLALGTSVGMRLATLVCLLIAIEGGRRLAWLWLGEPLAAVAAGWPLASGFEPMTVRFSPICTLTSSAPMLALNLPLRYQPREPVLNCLGWARKGWPLITT